MGEAAEDEGGIARGGADVEADVFEQGAVDAVELDADGGARRGGGEEEAEGGGADGGMGRHGERGAS